MIATDFAPNEQFDDAILSFKLLFQPWRWQSGKEIQDIKIEIAQLFNFSLCTFNFSLFFSGRSALYHLLKSLNLPANSEVIVQAFTCEAVVLPIIAAGYQPVYIDIEKESFSMALIDLEKKYRKNCHVLILQHTFGLTPKYRQQILQFAKNNNLAVIEDLAHGFSNSQLITNSLTTNHYFLLSFGRSKSFSSVFGGAIISFNKKVGEKLTKPTYSLIFRCLLYKPIAYLIKSTYNIYLGKIIHKIVNWLGLLIPEITNKEKGGRYDPLLDKTYPNALAILLLNQLKKYDKTQEQRKKNVRYYNNQLSRIQHLSSDISLLRYPLLINNRDQLINFARKNNIFLGQWYNQAVAPKSLDLNKVGYRVGNCPVAEDVCNKIINLPTNIDKKEAVKIISFFENSEFRI